MGCFCYQIIQKKKECACSTRKLHYIDFYMEFCPSVLNNTIIVGSETLDIDWIERCTEKDVQSRIDELLTDKKRSIDILHWFYRQFKKFSKIPGCTYNDFDELCECLYQTTGKAGQIWVKHHALKKILKYWEPSFSSLIDKISMSPLLSIIRGIGCSFHKKLMECDTEVLVRIWDMEQNIKGETQSMIFNGCNYDNSFYQKNRMMWILSSAIMIAKITNRIYPMAEDFKYPLALLSEDWNAVSTYENTTEDFWRAALLDKRIIGNIPDITLQHSDSPIYTQEASTNIESVCHNDITEPESRTLTKETTIKLGTMEEMNELVMADESVGSAHNCVEPVDGRHEHIETKKRKTTECGTTGKAKKSKRGRPPKKATPPIRIVIKPRREEDIGQSNEEGDNGNIWKTKFELLSIDYDKIKNERNNIIKFYDEFRQKNQKEIDRLILSIDAKNRYIWALKEKLNNITP